MNKKSNAHLAWCKIYYVYVIGWCHFKQLKNLGALQEKNGAFMVIKKCFDYLCKHFHVSNAYIREHIKRGFQSIYWTELLVSIEISAIKHQTHTFNYIIITQQLYFSVDKIKKKFYWAFLLEKQHKIQKSEKINFIRKCNEKSQKIKKLENQVVSKIKMFLSRCQYACIVLALTSIGAINNNNSRREGRVTISSRQNAWYYYHDIIAIATVAR